MAFILPQASFGALGAQKAFATKNIMQPGSRTSNITRANPTFPEWHLKLKTIYDNMVKKDMTLLLGRSWVFTLRAHDHDVGIAAWERPSF